MMLISIDGASKRNGKPDCSAAGIAYCKEIGSFNGIYEQSGNGIRSTNQRGEMLGCIAALRMAIDNGAEDLIIVTDSEYIFKALYNRWTYGWESRGWLTSLNEPVKNDDLWKTIHESLLMLEQKDVDLVIFHIKGHLVSIGEVTAHKLLDQSPSGAALFAAASDKYEVRLDTHSELFDKAHDLFVRNNGDMVAPEVFKNLVVVNTVADYAATKFLAMKEKISRK